MIALKWIWILMSATAVDVAFSSRCEEKLLNQSSYLDEDKKIYVEWITNSTHLIMKVTGKTKGWLGIGFSPSGTLKDADIVVGWVKNEKAYLQDCHGQLNESEPPVLDKQQDYVLSYGTENITHTIYCFERKLDTCDKDDYKLDIGTVRMIYAVSDNDPVNEDFADYNINNSGTTSKNIVGRRFKKPTGPDVKYVDFRMPNISLPDGQDTLYWCQFFSPPADLTTKHHIVGFEHVFEKEQEKLMHHFIVYQCIGNNIRDILKNSTGFECYAPGSPVPFSQCETAVIRWATGLKDLFYPDEVGYPFMDQIDGQEVFYMFDIHYNKPRNEKGVRDSSGLRIYYTSQLRKFDGGWFIIGINSFNPYLVIPPRQKNFTIPAHCAKECLEASLPKSGIQMFGYILHTHEAAIAVKLRQYRNDSELEPLASNIHYDFNYQTAQILVKNRMLLPGDSLTLECTYNTEERNVATIGAGSIRDEMCLAYIMYYSPITMERCNSVISPDTVNVLVGIKEIYPLKSPLDTIIIKEPAKFNNTPVAEYLKTIQWSQDQVNQLQQRMLEMNEIPSCTGTDTIDTKDLKTVNYPNAKPYKAADHCGKN